MDVAKGITWMKIFQEKIEDNKTYLSDLDDRIGDGDHGNNMSRGMESVIAELSKKDPTDLSDFFKIVSMSLIQNVGGASGPLYGTAFMEMMKVSKSSNEFKLLEEAGLKGIEKRGQSQPGEKTMVDVWNSVANDLASGGLNTEQIQEAVNQTKDMVATKGRASYLGDRSKGVLDPGAVSSGYLFEAALESGVV